MVGVGGRKEIESNTKVSSARGCLGPLIESLGTAERGLPWPAALSVLSMDDAAPRRRGKQGLHRHNQSGQGRRLVLPALDGNESKSTRSRC